MESQTHSKGGRPTSYKPEFAEKLIAYFKSFTDEPFTKEVMKKTTKYFDEAHGSGVKETHEEFKIIAKRLPTLFGFSRSIGVQYRTVYNWSTARLGAAPNKGEDDKREYKYPEFFHAYKEAKHFQTEFLTAVGMGGTSPSAFVIFTAKNVIGWRDKNEIGFTDGQGKDTNPGYIILPKRKTEEDAQKEFADQEAESETPTD